MLARIKFTKTGVMKYVGHLDMMRYFQKLLRRAQIPVAFSEGFSPHMIMSFAAPLGVGCTSQAEYIDITLTVNDFEEADYIKRCNAVQTDGIEVIRFAALPEKAPAAMASVCYADYRIGMRRGIPDRITEFLASDQITVTKKSKKGEREVDIRPMILNAEFIDGDIFLRLSQGSSANLKPELFMEAYESFLQIPYDPTGYVVHRVELYDAQMMPLIPESNGAQK